MMKPKYVLMFIFILLLSACTEEATISVTNRVGNTMMEKISYGNISLQTSRLLPGETSSTMVLSDQWDGVKFPMTAQLQFYMVTGEKRVFLKSKQAYTVDADQHLNIVIEDDTEVVNPMK